MGDVARWFERSARRSGVEARLPSTFDFETMTVREMLHLDSQLLMMDLGGLPEAELFEAIDLVGDSLIEAVSRW